MGIRFQKSIRLGKFVRLNLSKSGLGFSVGALGLRFGMGPRGKRLSANLPGSGLSYVKQWGRESKSGSSRSGKRAQELEAPRAPQPLPSPGFFAPQHEKDFAAGLEAYQAGQWEPAIERFRAASREEPAAAILAAAILALTEWDTVEAIELLEGVVQSDDEFPTPLMQKYGVDDELLNVAITPGVQVSVPIDGLGAALLLAELYQDREQLDEATGLLEEMAEYSNDPVLTLSLCEVYAMQGLWEGVIERGHGFQADDDVTLAIVIWYGRALQWKGLHEAALAVFTPALRKTKDRSPDLLREGRYWRAITYLHLGKKSQANKEFQKLYAEAPTFRDLEQRVSEAVTAPMRRVKPR